MPRHPMDEAYAHVLREEGMSFTKIDKELAEREGRSMPYAYNSVRRAVARFEKLLEAGDAQSTPS